MFHEKFKHFKIFKNEIVKQTMVNIFIDTNIILNFYHFSSDDLEELKKLVLLLKNSDVKLYLPEQVKDEFYRNRDNKIAVALKEFKKEKIDRQFPQMTKQYDEYEKMRDTIKTFEENKQAILEKLKEDISNKNLKADKIVKELFLNAKNIQISPEIFERAKKRFDLGKPPGKNKSYGDAINWECLKEESPNSEDFFIVTNDSDYLSEVDNSIINPYLFDEWKSDKIANLTVFKNLSGFFEDKFPDIKLFYEKEKTLLIDNLAKSGTFARTHSILAQLATFTDFSKEHVNDIILASVSNSQIFWIAQDEDVNEILINIARINNKLIDPELLNRFEEIYNENPKTDE